MANMIHKNYDERSLELHREHKGKLRISGTVPVTNRDELSLAYTPGVGAVSRAIFEDATLARTLTIKGNAVAVISDGTSVLGLGNIGPEAALPVMEGKCLLMKEFADIDAYPIVLNTQDTEEIIKTIIHIAPGFSGINLEDISAPRCFEIERRLQSELNIPVFHDDQHGTAIVVLAGLFNALKVVNKELKDIRVVMNGSGSAGIAIAKLLAHAGVGALTLVDSRGVVYLGRDDVNEYKSEIASLSQYTYVEGGLIENVVDADVFIGVSKENILSGDMVATMAHDPIIFALANPNPEIMPNEALHAGAKVIATGRSDFPNQVNNVLAFPGIFRGFLKYQVKQVTHDMKIAVARALASLVDNPHADMILPDPFDSRITQTVADAVGKSNTQ